MYILRTYPIINPLNLSAITCNKTDLIIFHSLICTSHMLSRSQVRKVRCKTKVWFTFERGIYSNLVVWTKLRSLLKNQNVWKESNSIQQSFTQNRKRECPSDKKQLWMCLHKLQHGCAHDGRRWWQYSEKEALFSIETALHYKLNQGFFFASTLYLEGVCNIWYFKQQWLKSKAVLD